ncbi:MAG: DUF371 domain-containing protein [Promethearchaeota archaeon]
MVILDTIYAYGHKNILCTHQTTIEITKDTYLTKRGNCILGIRASKACIDLNTTLKEKIKQGTKIKVIITLNDLTDIFYGYGDPRLTLSSKKAVIFRKSNYLCDRTILINCTKSSINLDRNLVKSIKNQQKKFKISFEVND